MLQPEPNTNPGEAGESQAKATLNTPGSQLSSDGGARHECDAQAAVSPNITGESQATFVMEPTLRMPGSQPLLSGDGAQIAADAQPSPSPIIAEIVQLQRMRQRWHRAEKALTLQGKAICRGWTEGDKVKANALFESAAESSDNLDPVLAMALGPFLAGIEQFRPLRKALEKRLEKLGQQLPIYSWIAEIKGFGALNFAKLIGEAGDIGSYRNPSCLWKRMGMAVIGNERQRKKSGADEALLHGYNPSRRAVAYLIGTCLIKAGDACRYRHVYTERRAHTLITHPDWTRKHSHNDAMRIMTKRVLRDLWSAWREAMYLPEPNIEAPPAPFSAQAERSANLRPEPKEALPSVPIPRKRKRPTTGCVEPITMASDAPIPVKTGKRRPKNRPKPKMAAAAATDKAP